MAQESKNEFISQKNENGYIIRKSNNDLNVSEVFPTNIKENFKSNK